MPANRSLPDLLISTRAMLPKRFQETVQIRDAVGIRLFFNQRRKDYDGSYAVGEEIRVAASSTATATRAYTPTSTSVASYGVRINTEWVNFLDRIPYNMLEKAFNSGDESKIFNLIDMRRSAHFDGFLSNLLEPHIWDEPAASTDDLHIWGVPYWLRRLSSADTTGSFSGTTIRYTGGTTATTLGITTDGSSAPDANTAANFNLRNWNASYSSGTFDLPCFKTVRRAANRTNFMRLSQLKGEMTENTKQVLVMPEEQFEQYQDLANQDNTLKATGGDLTKYDLYRVHGMEVIPCPALNSKTYQPIYGLKLDQWEGMVQTGKFMTQVNALEDPSDPLTTTENVLTVCNIRAKNPRHAGFVVTYI